MSKNVSSVEKFIKSKQAVLMNSLNDVIDHPGTKGDHCETAWINFFKGFLPSKYDVAKGFVFDSQGNKSDQIDVIIYEALYAPLIFKTENGEKYITAESVYAVFESKSEINKETLEYADHKAASVRKLFRSARGVINAGVYQKARSLTPIIGGILALDSISPHAIEQHLRDTQNIDIGCSVKKTAFIAHRDINKEIIGITLSPPEETLLSFFFMILDELHKIGTVAGLDIRDYADATLNKVKLKRFD